MDLESVRLSGTRLGHMAEELACNEPLMNVSFPRQWLEIGVTSSAGIRKWDPSENTKVDGNLQQDIHHMCPKSKPSTVISCLSYQRMRYMDE